MEVNMNGKIIDELSDLLPSEIISMIIGKLLGDGNLTIEKYKRPRLRFSHKIQDRAWCQHSRDMLASSISFPPMKYRKIYDTRMAKGFTESYYAQSHTHLALDLLKQLWYPSNHKTIPFKLLEKFFTDISLAWWYMDDGHLKMVNNQPSKIILSTESFTLLELQQLCTLLFEKFHLEFKIDKAKRLVVYNKMQIYYFLKLVQPYLVDCMYRKTLLKSSLCQIKDLKRTTIYLPLKLSSPTVQIHEALQELKELINISTDSVRYIRMYPSLLKNICMQNHNHFSYQVTLPPHLTREIIKLQNITGIRMSEIVHWSFINQKEKTP
jgi:LAGLIDADG DNA endonuclease family